METKILKNVCEKWDEIARGGTAKRKKGRGGV